MSSCPDIAAALNSLFGLCYNPNNTVFPTSMLHDAAQHYQAHLEQIGDYLIQGPGVWWKHTSRGVMFLDGDGEMEYHDNGPNLQHFRSTSLSEIFLYLQQQWEACCNSDIVLPAAYLRFYGQDGTLERISESTESASIHVTMENQDVPVNLQISKPVESIHAEQIADTQEQDTHDLPVSTINQQLVQSNGNALMDICTGQPRGEDDDAAILPVYKHKTRLGKLLSGILDDSQQLQEFDELRYRLKNTSDRNIRRLKLKYKHLEELFQRQLLTQYKENSDENTRKRCGKVLVCEWGLKV